MGAGCRGYLAPTPSRAACQLLIHFQREAFSLDHFASAWPGEGPEGVLQGAVPAVPPSAQHSSLPSSPVPPPGGATQQLLPSWCLGSSLHCPVYKALLGAHPVGEGQLFGGGVSALPWALGKGWPPLSGY